MGVALPRKVPDMFLFDEKRELADRRISDKGPPAGNRERRVETDRRQTKMTEITFHEWTSCFVKYQERAAARRATGAASARSRPHAGS